MTPKEIFDKLQARFGDNILELNEEVATPYILFEAPAVVEIMTTLKDDPELSFDMLLCLGAVDYDKDNIIEIVYHFDSSEKMHCIALKTKLPRDEPRVKSVIRVWKAADWHEREAFDLMGVTFEGHPNLKRLLMPEDWEGYPLRKDYKQPEFYNGIPTR